MYWDFKSSACGDQIEKHMEDDVETGVHGILSEWVVGLMAACRDWNRTWKP